MYRGTIVNGTIKGRLESLFCSFLCVFELRCSSIGFMATKPTKRSRNKTDLPDKAQDLCVTCKKKVTTDAIECQWCTQWEHKVCAKISDDEYKLLGGSSQNIMFFCSLCCSKVPYALSNYDDSQTSMNFDNRLREMETKLTSIIDDINIKLDNPYKKIESKLTCQPDGNMDADPPPKTNTISSESVVSLTTSFVAEQKEREKRELNLVLHNVPKSTAPGGSTRKQEDIAKISGIFDEYADVKPTIKNAIRLGKKDTNKSRSQKITVGSTQKKSQCCVINLN